MATKIELIEEAKALGLTVDENAHPFAIMAMIKKAKEGSGGLSVATQSSLTPLPEQTTLQSDSPDKLSNGAFIGAEVPISPTTEKKRDAIPDTIPTVPFDITKLSADQLKQLKSLLEQTPSIVSNSRPTITVRKFNGKFVIGVKNASSKVILDPIEQKPVTKITIPVLYYGANDFVTEDYKEFMGSERVKCVVKDTREVKDRIIEGVVFSMELKKEVEQVVNTIVRFYTVILPNGEEIQLFEDAVNL